VQASGRAAQPPGELDLFLFGEGTHRRLWDLLGGHLHEAGGATFAVWAPNAKQVSVVGDWAGWNFGSTGETLLAPQGTSGIWWGCEPRAKAGDRYKFLIDGVDGQRSERADPVATAAEVPPATASVLFATNYDWTSASSADWRAARAERNSGRLSVYEVHLGSWRRHPDGRAHTAREAAEPLADWASSLGFTHVELMPVASHPFGGSWGYQISGYYAPDARLGSPDDLRYLIDVCHDRGLGVILDWVPAHFPKDRFALAQFDGTALYEHADPQRGEHPDWGTLVFNHGRNEVRNFLVANALYWLEEFRVDGLRVDAVASMLYLDYSREPGEWVPNAQGGREDLDAVAFVQELNEVVGQEQPGSLVIAEESTSWSGVTRPTEWGGLGFSRKWNLGWMHDTLSYFAQDPIHRAFHHHELTFPMVYAPDERCTRCQAPTKNNLRICEACWLGSGVTPADNCSLWDASLPRSENGHTMVRSTGSCCSATATKVSADSSRISTLCRHSTRHFGLEMMILITILDGLMQTTMSTQSFHFGGQSQTGTD
jgi:1,4-alpha-glucan branching enzyme